MSLLALNSSCLNVLVMVPSSSNADDARPRTLSFCLRVNQSPSKSATQKEQYQQPAKKMSALRVELPTLSSQYCHFDWCKITHDELLFHQCTSVASWRRSIRQECCRNKKFMYTKIHPIADPYLLSKQQKQVCMWLAAKERSRPELNRGYRKALLQAYWLNHTDNSKGVVRIRCANHYTTKPMIG